MPTVVDLAGTKLCPTIWALSLFSLGMAMTTFRKFIYPSSACADAKGEAEQQPLDGVVARVGSADVQRRHGVPRCARGALDERDGERGGDGEEQAAELSWSAQRRAAQSRSARSAPSAPRGASGAAAWLWLAGIWLKEAPRRLRRATACRTKKRRPPVRASARSGLISGAPTARPARAARGRAGRAGAHQG